jgi:hypothetical protein
LHKKLPRLKLAALIQEAQQVNNETIKSVALILATMYAVYHVTGLRRLITNSF